MHSPHSPHSPQPITHTAHAATPPAGSSSSLYDAIHQHIFSLPDATLLYPGHDYKGRSSSSVAEEKAHNPRLKLGTTKDQFIHIMANLGLPAPKQIELALPANLRDGYGCQGCPHG
jgi:sulfur dioxygenase